MNHKTDEKVAEIAARLRKIHELKNLTREQFCERLGENVEYWGKSERGEQTISLGKLLQVCEVYHIRIEEIITLDFQERDTQQLRDSIVALLDECDYHQLEIIHKFITDIASKQPGDLSVCQQRLLPQIEMSRIPGAQHFLHWQYL